MTKHNSMPARTTIAQACAKGFNIEHAKAGDRLGKDLGCEADDAVEIVKGFREATKQRWWLSFCDESMPTGDQNLGACVVEADDLESAIRAAWRNGCNPGGEVAAIPLPIGSEGDALPLNTLKTADEWAEFTAVVRTGDMDEDAQESIDTACPSCNRPYPMLDGPPDSMMETDV